MTDVEQDPPTDEIPATGAALFDGERAEAGEYEEMPARRPRRRRWLTVVAVVVVVALLVVVAGYAKVRGEIDPSGRGADVQVTLPFGASTGQIAKILQKNHVIGNATVFSTYVRFKGGGAFQAGDYTLRRHEPYHELMSVLTKGPEVTVHKITIPEGFTLAQIAARVGKVPDRSTDRFLQLANAGQVHSKMAPAPSNNLEGLLFPDTYVLDKKDDEAVILQRMVDSMDEHLATIDVQAAAARLGVTPYQIVIIASMVEREAKVPEDRGPIASVIYNRLKRGMPLGIDATLLYALNGDLEALKRNPHQASPYNTRDTKGLPPTPIANPGVPSLEAAANPPSTPFLFYVLSDANGKHAFATNSADFDKLVAQARAKGLL